MVVGAGVGGVEVGVTVAVGGAAVIVAVGVGDGFVEALIDGEGLGRGDAVA